jgi:hypothetical protein
MLTQIQRNRVAVPLQRTMRHVDELQGELKAMMESDFDPGHTPTSMPAHLERMSKAAEYAAPKAARLFYLRGAVKRLIDVIISDRELAAATKWCNIPG